MGNFTQTQMDCLKWKDKKLKNWKFLFTHAILTLILSKERRDLDTLLKFLKVLLLGKMAS